MILPDFPKKLHEIENILGRKGVGRARGALLRSATVFVQAGSA